MSLTAHLFLFAALPFFASAQANELRWSAPYIEAHELILQYNLTEATEQLAPQPESPEKAYLLNLKDFIQSLYTEDIDIYDRYLKSIDDRARWIEQLPEGNFEKAFYLADMKLQEALFRIRYGDYVSGLYQLWQANNQVHDFSEIEEQIPPFLKAKGIINLLIGLTPNNYKWVTNLIGLNGDTDAGIYQLAKLSESAGPIADEALIILGYFYAYPLQTPEKAIDCFTKVLEKQPENLLAKFMLATSMNKNHQGESAIHLLEGITGDEKDRLPNIYYLMGDVYLQRGDIILARNNYQQFIERYEGGNFRKDAVTKIAVGYLLEGNGDQFDKWKEKAYAIGVTATEPDKNAKVLLDELSNYPVELLKTRLLTDGGYWERADEALQSIKNPGNLTTRWECEYYYRKARLNHLQSNYDMAISNYESALSLAHKQPWYIGANAALQLGVILKAKGMNLEATAYFKKAKEFDNHPYKSSIDSKAELELSRMKSK